MTIFSIIFLIAFIAFFIFVIWLILQEKPLVWKAVAVVALLIAAAFLKSLLSK
jgi:hypothetical protein